MKETLSHSKQVYEKEIRRARKEAFKASSDNIRLHEELKTFRDSESGLRTQLESTKQTVATVEKEAFSAQYKLVEVEEEFARMQQSIKVIERERDALKTSLKEEEEARIAAEDRIPLPVPATPNEFSSPKKKRATPRSTPTPTPKRQSRRIDHDVFVNNAKVAETTIALLKRQLEEETLSKKSAEDLVDFMKLECQLKRCCCRRAEADAKIYVFDDQYDAVVAGIRKEIQKCGRSAKSSTSHSDKEKTRRHKRAESVRPKTPIRHVEEDTTTAMEPLIEFSPVTGTFRTIRSPLKTQSEETKLESIPREEIKPCKPLQEDVEKQNLRLDEVEPHYLPQEDVKRYDLAQENILTPRLSPAPSLDPVPLSESPSLLSLAEKGTITNGLQGDCEVLPPRLPEPSSTEAEPEPESAPATPQKSDSTLRPSDADLLSFTPLNPSATFRAHFQPHHRQEPQPHQETVPRLLPAPPLAHSESYILSQTTTTTVPLANEPSTPTTKTLFQNPSYTFGTTGIGTGIAVGYSPGTTKTREEALQSIERWRRGRSRSVVLGGTPRRLGGVLVTSNGVGVGVGGRKGEVELSGATTPGKRDCSAPVPRTPREF